MMKPKALIAGNWKMNGLRADGLALARAVREGAKGMSGRTSGLSAGDPSGRGRRGAVGQRRCPRRAGLRGCAARRAYRRYRGGDAGRSRLPLCDCRPFGTAQLAWRDGRHRSRQGRSRSDGGADGNRLPGRNRGRARPGRDAGGGGAPARRLPSGQGITGQYRGGLRAGLGHRHRAHALQCRHPGSALLICGGNWRSMRARPMAFVCSMADRSNRPMPAKSWPCLM